MAFLAGVFERVARHARSLIEHCRLGVATRLEKGQRRVASRCFIVTAFAGLGLMACRARGAIERRYLSVLIVFPPRAV